MSAWRVEKGEFDADKTWPQHVLLKDIHHRSDIVRRFYFNGPLVDVARQLIGPNIKGARASQSTSVRNRFKQD